MDILRIPLKIGNTLITSIQTELHDASAVQFKDDLLERMHTTRAQGVVIADISLVMQDGYSTSRGMGRACQERNV